MAIFMNLGDIKGEATDADHKDWVQILSLDFSVTQMSSGERHGTGGRTGGMPQHSDISMTKPLDKASVDLHQHACTGKILPEVVIEKCRMAEGKECYLKLTLKKVLVKHVGISGTSMDEQFNEQVLLDPEEIVIEYTPFDANNKKQSPIAKGWNRTESKEV